MYRCAVRKRADQASKDTFIPVFFPPLPEVSPSEIENLLDLRPDETAQVDLSFFVPLNQKLTIPLRFIQD